MNENKNINTSANFWDLWDICRKYRVEEKI